MFCLIPLLLIVSNVLALLTADKPYYDLADAETHFADFIKKYDKKYESYEEYKTRFEIFKDALKSINDMNANQDATATFGVTKFADLTREEFKRTYLGCVASKSTGRNESDVITVKKEWIDDAPDSIDYRDQNLVTKVKEQLACGSCFVFSAIGNIEGQYAKKHKQLVSFSEQQGLDCDIVPTEDCEHGGESINVMKSLAQIGGCEREEDYIYVGYKNECKSDKSKIVAKVLRGNLINTSTEEELKGAVAHFGPLSVSLKYPTGRFYVSGVWSPEEGTCDGDPDHAIVVVGYGKDAASGKDYWLIKNSWGENYGEKGYFRLERGKGLCKIGKEDSATADVE